MDSPTVAAATEGGSPFFKLYEIYLVSVERKQTVEAFGGILGLQDPVSCVSLFSLLSCFSCFFFDSALVSISYMAFFSSCLIGGGALCPPPPPRRARVKDLRSNSRFMLSTFCPS